MTDEKIVSSVRVDAGKAHDTLTVYNRGARAGTLVVLPEDSATIAQRLLDKDDDIVQPTKYGLAVDRRGPYAELTHVEKQQWAVRDGFDNCLNRDGEWEYEPSPSSRDDEFIARTRYTKKEALARLRGLALTLLRTPEESSDGA